VIWAKNNWSELLPDHFSGGVLGILGAAATVAILVMATLWLDRRIDGWLSHGPHQSVWGRLLSRRGALIRVILWTCTLVLALTAAIKISPPLAWMLLPAGGLALALAISRLLRDALMGIGNALSRRVQVGDFVAIGEIQGQVLRVGIRILQLKALDGTIVDVPQRRISADGIRQLRVDDGGHPVAIELPLPNDLSLAEVMEEARLAAALAPHAHLCARPEVAVTDETPARIRVHGQAINPFVAGQFRGEVALAFQDAVRSLRSRSK
jgi:small-conductance mechanosensitive channel